MVEMKTHEITMIDANCVSVMKCTFADKLFQAIRVRTVAVEKGVDFGWIDY